MKISKDDLNRNFWWEDADGNVIDNPGDYVSEEDPRIKYGDHITYHTLWPLDITERVDSYCWRPHTRLQKILCEFKLPRRLLEKKHKTEKTFNHSFDFTTHIGSEDVIIAMVNSGDYTLSEALMLYSQSCERCMNVLANKYLGQYEGYPEFSEEWKKCNTVCKFCKD